MSTPRTTVPPYDADLAQARWWKSSYSGGANDCVEIADLTEAECPGVAIRDSKNPQGPALVLAVDSFVAFIHGIDHGWHDV